MACWPGQLGIVMPIESRTAQANPKEASLEVRRVMLPVVADRITRGKALCYRQFMLPFLISAAMAATPTISKVYDSQPKDEAVSGAPVYQIHATTEREGDAESVK